MFLLKTGNRYQTRYWEDVKEGEELPEIKLNVTYRKIITGVGATRDFFPGHFNPEYARDQGVESIFLNTPIFEGFVDRLLTNWSGPGAWIKKRKIQIRGTVPAGSIISASGKVTKTYTEDGQYLVDLEVSVLREGHNICPASATLVLPSRNSR
ncbi:MAG: hypothetical protein ACUVXA_13395 [Candidatus Jordarchaeum sp.]|uniref:hypothetical protein n=1 Tax=Candidatus Jordarchaeum sp. TaxID=2823881 RepID=UPI00404940AF